MTLLQIKSPRTNLSSLNSSLHGEVHWRENRPNDMSMALCGFDILNGIIFAPEEPAGSSFVYDQSTADQVDWSILFIKSNDYTCFFVKVRRKNIELSSHCTK